MPKSMIYNLGLTGIFPSNEDIERLDELFGIGDDYIDGRLADIVTDKKDLELLRLLYTNTIKMMIASDLTFIKEQEFSSDRNVLCLF